METATKEFLYEIEEVTEFRRSMIINSADRLEISGAKYYVSEKGDDGNDGLSPDTPWRTRARVSAAELNPGDAVLFRRGDTFRGWVQTRSGVTYGAYGRGAKPKLYGWDKCLADPALWVLEYPEQNIWRMTEKILDPGTLVFNHGEEHSIKLIPSYINGKFVCRNDESKLFDMREEMVRDLDIYWYFEDILTTTPSKGENFPIPEMGEKSLGTLYLRCDRGNPGEIFKSIEALPRRAMFRVGSNSDVHIDNICMKYIGLHAVAAGGECVKGLKVTNCEIGWIGGTIQHYLGTDPNYPQGGRGTVTRFGNGIEIYGGCKDYLVSDCYIYQVYDAGITHQVTTWGKKRVMSDITYRNNLVEYCVYSIEYFLEMNDGDRESYMENIEMSDNILRFSGYGWGQQRHNTDTPAHIKGWSYTNKASSYVIRNNIFDRAAYRMLHLVAEEQSSCPVMKDNMYIQFEGGKIGQYGGNAEKEPENLDFDLEAEEKIREIFGDKTASVYMVK
ncbi:MAG: hypothetical protein IJY04_06220 [Clostridia bacterium]|nr:hypothetical protein [Clostridia bacterium]